MQNDGLYILILITAVNFFSWFYSPQWAKVSHYRGFVITLKHTSDQPVAETST
jgi:hypothetical protein